MGTEASVQGLLRNSPGWLSLDPPEGKQGAPRRVFNGKICQLFTRENQVQDLALSLN